MLSPKIPDEHVTGLVGIKNLKNDQFIKLVEVLSEVPPVIHLEKLVSLVTKQLAHMETSAITEILVTVVSLYSLMLRMDRSPLEVASDVCIAMQNSAHEGLKLEDTAQKHFKERLITLLGIGSLLYTAKAPSIIYEHENIFSDCRIITDIRPIFGLNPNEEPKAAALVHTLNVTCMRDNKTTEFYIAMDSEDLNRLNDTLQRALAKANTLEPMITKMELSLLKE